jgi:acetyl-CoA carboxylase biotin carboxyl carrier protein
MEIEKIRSLAKLMNEESLSRIEIEEGGNKIRIDRQAVGACAPDAGVAAAYKTDAAAKAEDKEKAERDDYKEFKSPMVGVFYAASSPESQPYVKVGSHVKKGDVLCIIEAMKLLNELNSDMDGEIAEVCAENGQVVEYGQTLFKLK